MLVQATVVQFTVSPEEMDGLRCLWLIIMVMGFARVDCDESNTTQAVAMAAAVIKSSSPAPIPSKYANCTDRTVSDAILIDASEKKLMNALFRFVCVHR